MGEYKEIVIFQDPHEIVLGVFEDSNEHGFLTGKPASFIFRILLITTFLAALKCLENSIIPGLIETSVSLALIILSILLMIIIVKNSIPFLIKVLGG